MSTNAITRREVLHYIVTKNRVNKDIEGDSLKIKVKTLPMARELARDLFRNGNFKSLTNSNDIILPI